MKILHVITGLGLGGAEAMLAKLVGASNDARHVVVSLSGHGAIALEIEHAGGLVYHLRVDNFSRAPAGLRRLCAIVRHERPDIIQGWLNHGNLFAALAKLTAGSEAPLTYNVRQSLLGMRFEKWHTRQVIRIAGRLSPLTSAIIYNSNTGATDHESIGYDSTKRRYVPNGFDTNRFYPDATRRSATRADLGIGEDDIVVGLIARFDPWKNHESFFSAASEILKVEPAVRFLLAGEGMIAENEALAALIKDPQVRERTLLIGPRYDMPDIHRVLDIACNVSHGEGFPNAIGEAMATAVPCVVTDVGDMREILGDAGIVCEKSPAAMVKGILELIQVDGQRRLFLGSRARQRIEANYSLPAIVSRYEAIYQQLIDEQKSRARR